MDHFGYKAHPLRDHDDPLWYDRDSFIPWLEHMKDNRRLHIINDPSIQGENDKKFQVTKKKIEKKIEKLIKEEKEEKAAERSPPAKRKIKTKKESGKGNKRAKSGKGASHVSSDESGPEAAPSGTKSRPSTAGKSPRIFNKEAFKGSGRGGSDIDSSSSESDGQ